MHAFAIDQPAFPAQHDVNAQITEARPIERDLANAHAQWRLVFRLGAPIPGRAAQQCQPARLLHARPEVLADPPGELAAARRFQTFFRSTSWRMCRSSVRSATTRLSRAFSSS